MQHKTNNSSWFDMMRDNFWMFIALLYTQPTPPPPPPQTELEYLFSDTDNLDITADNDIYLDYLDELQNTLEEHIEDVDDHIDDTYDETYFDFDGC